MKSLITFNHIVLIQLLTFNSSKESEIMVEQKAESIKIKINAEAFIHENTGNIKDFYKISSAIGKGKLEKRLTIFFL